VKKYWYAILLAGVACTPTRNDTDEIQCIDATKARTGRLVVLNHPLVHHHLSIIRDKNTNSSAFRFSLKRIAEQLVYEATKNLSTIAVNVSTPVADTICKCVDPNRKIFIASILRAGLGITNIASDIIPNAEIHLLGMYRDEKTHSPVWYYNKLPETFKNTHSITVFICDTMLATGGSASEVVKMYLRKGIPEENIIIICVISALKGVNKLFEEFPKIKIITASVDRTLNQECYIVPGLGDAGDRIFNTVVAK
jgi:uracil phosphoribosyltransferase